MKPIYYDVGDIVLFEYKGWLDKSIARPVTLVGRVMNVEQIVNASYEANYYYMIDCGEYGIQAKVPSERLRLTPQPDVDGMCDV